MFSMRHTTGLFLAMCCTVSSALASVSDDVSAQLAEQRKTFVRAESFAAKPKSTDYYLYQKALEGYPLAPYFELKTLVAYPYLSNRDKIDAFLTAYEGTPLDKPLRTRWLNYLAEKQQAALFLHYYRDLGDTELDCQRLVYMLQRAELREQALNEAERYWLVGKSQPKACDPVFRAWKNAGLRTEQHVWKRLTLAADGGKATLIPYLKTLLPADKQYLADLWLKVRRSPSYVSRLSQFPGTYPQLEAEILAYGLSRLIWRDTELALKTWQKVNKRYVLNEAQQRRVSNRFAVALATENHPRAEEWLERANQLEDDDELFRWHLAHVLRQGNWQHALDLVSVAPEGIQQDYTYRYWQARALEAMDAAPQANQQFQQLAQVRHYYGFLASGRVSAAPSLDDKPLAFSAQELAAVANRPAARRAYEFLQLKRYASARREWMYLRDTLDERQKAMAAVLADSWQWHDQAIFTFADAGYMDDVKRRFPMAYQHELVTHAERNRIDPAWAFAIARRESSFMHDAYSHAGARGLMQLLPGTARYLAKKSITSNSLFDPDNNAAYGTQYLRYLMDKMADNPILATASYNAGWRRVKNWVPENDAMAVDVWIETIPYKETRNYVKAVLAYRQIYAARLGKDDNLFAPLANMQISASSLR